MVQVSTIKYLNAVREQFQSCWLFSFLPPLTPNHKTTLEHKRNISAAEAELQEHFPKTSDRQTDTQRSRAWPPARVARQESFPRESSGQSCSSSQQGCKSQLTVGMDLAGGNNPCPEWGSSYPSPASSFWGAASPGCQQSAGPALGLLLQAAPPGSPLLWRGAGVPSAAAGTWHQTCLKRLSSAGHLPQAAGKARLTILWV